MIGLKIYVSDDINDKLCLNGDFLDLYPDETINITLKQTDIKEIGSNYSDYTNDFNIPATDRNNRVLKYWYDQYNDNQFSTGKVNCRIDIDGIFFRKGIIIINSCESDDNGNIKSYNIKFNTDLKSIKDILGDTKLGDLISPDSTLSQFKQHLTTSLYSSGYYNDDLPMNMNEMDVLTSSPLILLNNGIIDYSKNRITPLIEENLIDIRNLRPVVNFSSLINIVSKYLSNNSKNIIKIPNDLRNLLSIINLHLNKKEEPYISVQILPIGSLTFTKSGTSISSDEFVVNNFYNYFTITKKMVSHKRTFQYNIQFEAKTSNDSIPYKLFIQELILNDDGSIDDEATNKQDNQGYVASSEFLTGNRTISLNNIWRNVAFNNSYNNKKKTYRFIVESKGNITFSLINFRIFHITFEYFTEYSLSTCLYYSYLSNFNLTTSFNLAENTPDITSYDFLNGIMKMFNCVIDQSNNVGLYPSSNYSGSYINTIDYDYDKIYNEIIPYKWWLKKGNTYDISEYVNRKHKQTKLKSFNKYNFKHSNTEFYSNFLYKEGQTSKREYGDFTEEIKNTINDGEFKIETKFNLLNYYQIDNVPEFWTTTLHNYNFPHIQMSTLLDSGYEKNIINKPLIMACNRAEFVYDYSNNEGIFWTSNQYKLQDETVLSSTSTFASNTLYIPSNWKNRYINFDSLSLTFSKEIDKGFLQEKNLYTEFYKNIIFKYNSPYSREYEYEGYLPITILHKLRLNDSLIISNKKYYINELTINLNTGNVKFKLHNVIEEEVIDENLVDTTPPTAPTYMSSVYNEIDTTFTIFGSGATDIIGTLFSSGISGYEISYSTDGITYTTLPFVSESSGTFSYTTSPGFTTAGTYTFRARTIDNAGNWSTEYIYSTSLINDTNLPTLPTYFQVIPFPTKISVYWAGASDNVGISGYELSYSVDNTNWTTLPFITSNATNGTYDINLLNPDTFYYVRLRVKDSSNNWSSGYKNISTTTTEIKSILLSDNYISFLDIIDTDSNCNNLNPPSEIKYVENDNLTIGDIIYDDINLTIPFSGIGNFKQKKIGSGIINVCEIDTGGQIISIYEDYCQSEYYISYRSEESVSGNTNQDFSSPEDVCWFSIDSNYPIYHTTELSYMVSHDYFYNTSSLTSYFNGQNRWWHIGGYTVKIDTIGRLIGIISC